MRGDGRIFQKPGTRYWHMAYYVDGREVSESTKQTDEQRARRMLRDRLTEIRSGEAVPHERHVTLQDLVDFVLADYEAKQRRSLSTVRYPLRHLVEHFGAHTKAVAITSERAMRYIRARRQQEASTATINMELALLGRAFTLAIRARRLGPTRRPFLERLPADETRVRQGFFTRDQVDALGAHLPAAIADVVRFLFFSAWRVGEVRTLEWRDVDRVDGVVRLRAEQSKNRHGRVLPVDEGELAEVLARRHQARRLDCPYVFHRGGRPIGDFRKLWARACEAIGVPGRIVHDLRRSGVKHLIDAGVDPHTVMAFSGHRTASMLRRYHIIDVHDLRHAATRASSYGGRPSSVVALRTAEHRQNAGSGPAIAAAVELGAR